MPRVPWKVPEKNKTTNIVECRFFFPRELQERALVTSINKKELDVGCGAQCGAPCPVPASMALGWLANTDLQPAVTYKRTRTVRCEVCVEAKSNLPYQELQDQGSRLLYLL